MQFKNVEIWGDSVLKGVVYDEARGRYVLLKDSAPTLVARESGLTIANRSMMGRTAPEGLELFGANEHMLADTLVLIEYGGNDCDYNWAEVSDDPSLNHQPHVAVDAFVRALTQFVDMARARGGTPVLATLPPLDCHRYLSWITRGGLSRERILEFIGVPERIYRWQEYYSSLVQRVAHDVRCTYLPIRDRFLEVVRGENVLCVDGIHPNELGHRLIADAALMAIG